MRSAESAREYLVRKLIPAITLASIVAGLCSLLGGELFRVRADSAARARTEAIATATSAFLNTLSPEQRQKVQFSFDPQQTATVARFKPSGGPGGPGGPPNGNNQPGAAAPSPAAPPRPPQNAGNAGPGEGPSGAPGMGPAGGFTGERYGDAVWSNFPVSDVPRPGLRFGDLTTTQRDAAMHIFQVALSTKGYGKILETMGSDQAHSETHPPYCAGTACYTIGIFGTPSATTPWMLEFGGHHLGLNLTMRGEHGVITPTLTGAQPAVYTSQGKTVRALAAENDKAFDLLNALDQNQRTAAILNYRVADLVLGPGHEQDTIPPEGLKASAMNERQRTMLLGLIAEWVGIVNDAYAAPRMAQIKAGINDTYFAWSGPTSHEPGRNGSAYYRIQGPRVVIEFSPQDTQGDPTMHVHTMYRDPLDDYGRTFTRP